MPRPTKAADGQRTERLAFRASKRVKDYLESLVESGEALSLADACNSAIIQSSGFAEFDQHEERFIGALLNFDVAAWFALHHPTFEIEFFRDPEFQEAAETMINLTENEINFATEKVDYVVRKFEGITKESARVVLKFASDQLGEDRCQKLIQCYQPDLVFEDLDSMVKSYAKKFLRRAEFIQLEFSETQKSKN